MAGGGDVKVEVDGVGMTVMEVEGGGAETRPPLSLSLLLFLLGLLLHFLLCLPKDKLPPRLH